MKNLGIRLVAKVAADNAELVKTLKRTKTLHTKLQIMAVVAAGAAGITVGEIIEQVTESLATDPKATDKDRERWMKEEAKGFVPHVAWISKAYGDYITTNGEYEKEAREKKEKAAAPAAPEGDAPVLESDDAPALTEEEAPL